MKKEVVEQPKQNEVKPETSKEQRMESTLIYLRDNVVHGSPVHVERINRALGV